ncbi:DUF5343 domain-containing protein [Halobacteriovorax sp.]|uniref:DUF5343 domain-containing protein n=1 Tax=Halobacteriovorax sp. TaxID=2020862 RepID=UPI003562640E
MSLISTYAMSPSKIPDFFSSIQKGQAPSKFTHQYLKDIGFKGTNDRPFIKLLKDLKFLTSDGTPTQKYHEYRDSSKSKSVLGQTLKEAYSDLFVIIEKPSQSDRSQIEGKFKSNFNSTDDLAKRRASTFFALLEIADIEQIGLTQDITQESETGKSTDTPTQTHQPLHLKSAGFHYNIQVHLPATKDIEVYNSIFKSIKENLFE